jgi:hypothetical protein
VVGSAHLLDGAEEGFGLLASPSQAASSQTGWSAMVSHHSLDRSVGVWLVGWLAGWLIG